MDFVPTLLVAIIIVFVNSAIFPSVSVKRPSSKICRKVISIFGCAFSISSIKTRLKGLFLTFSVKVPAVFPSGEPMILLMLSTC